MHHALKTVLITGGNGNLGRLVGAKLLAAGKRVIKFDIPGTEPDSTHPNENVITGDIRDEDTLRAYSKIITRAQSTILLRYYREALRRTWQTPGQLMRRLHLTC